MTAALVFSIANTIALIGWIVLAFGVLLKRPWWSDQLAGRFLPLGFAVLYAILIVFFIGSAEGGFNTLTDVQTLFTFEWLALAGWIHYLAFDLFIGAWIARRMREEALPRWPLMIILPLTFMFGPAGLLAFELTRLALKPTSIAIQE